MALARTKVATVVFPTRSYANGTPHAKLPAARAWRIVARRAVDFAANAQAVLDKLVPAAPVGCQDGAFPVWVRLTGPESRSLDSGFLLVDGDGWNLEPTGPEWHIEAVGAGSAAADQFVYVVETVQDVEEAGQVNGSKALSTLRSRILSTLVLSGANWQSAKFTPSRERGILLMAETVGGAGSRNVRLQGYSDDGATLEWESLILPAAGFGTGQRTRLWFGEPANAPPATYASPGSANGLYDGTNCAGAGAGNPDIYVPVPLFNVMAFNSRDLTTIDTRFKVWL